LFSFTKAVLMIYLDNNATTPVDPEVLDTMLPYFIEYPGNASSKTHALGQKSGTAVDLARQSMASNLGVDPDEIIFTSGATESNNLAIKGYFELQKSHKNHIITVKTEHKAVLDVCKYLEKNGAHITYLDVDHHGLIDLEELEDAITDQTMMVCAMWVNNETGVMQDVSSIGDICKKHGVIFMCDATQAVGKIPVLPRETGIHLLSFTAHKLYGPKGAGALFISRRSPRLNVISQMMGGGQENGFRAGTLNVPGIVGLAKAVALAHANIETESQHVQRMRDSLQNTLLELGDVQINAYAAPRMYNVINFTTRFADSASIITHIRNTVAVSTGSACSSANAQPSHVLKAMGFTDEQARSTIRISLGRFNTLEEVNTASKLLIDAITTVREENPLWSLYQQGVEF
jgi:cysteine desulfurase